MNTVVDKLLEVDKEARRMLDEAQQYYDNTLAELEDEKRRMWESYAAKAKLHLETLEAEQQQEVAEVVAEVRERTARLIRTMEDHYERNHRQWEDGLVAGVIGRDAG